MLAIELSREIAKDSKAELAHLIKQILRKAPSDIAETYMEEYDVDHNLPSDDMEEVYNERLRLKLDAGLGAGLFQAYRARLASETSSIEVAISDRSKVGIIILTALMMHCGAKIEADHVKLYVASSRFWNCTSCGRASCVTSVRGDETEN